MNLNKSIAAQIKNAIFQNKKIEKVQIDFVPYDKISNQNLKEHIDRVGVVL